MNDKERQAIIRAQNHRWVVTHVGEELILMRRPFLRPKCLKVTLGIWPDGRVTVVEKR